MRLRELALVAVLVLLPGQARADQLGAYDAAELYSALIVDAKNDDVRRALLHVAGHDVRVTPGQVADLAVILCLNVPTEPGCGGRPL